MASGISVEARTELLRALRQRYREASRKDKTKILDEFVAVAKCHRKHAVRLLVRADDESPVKPVANGQRIHGINIPPILAKRCSGSLSGEPKSNLRVDANAQCCP